MDIMSARLLDNGFRLLGLVMIGTVICFLLTPIFVTILMAFDSREYLGPAAALAFVTLVRPILLRRLFPARTGH
jgi:hypothetical protein